MHVVRFFGADCEWFQKSRQGHTWHSTLPPRKISQDPKLVALAITRYNEIYAFLPSSALPLRYCIDTPDSLGIHIALCLLTSALVSITGVFSNLAACMMAVINFCPVSLIGEAWVYFGVREFLNRVRETGLIKSTEHGSSCLPRATWMHRYELNIPITQLSGHSILSRCHTWKCKLLLVCITFSDSDWRVLVNKGWTLRKKQPIL